MAAVNFSRVAIIGVGLLGGSVALALKRQLPDVVIVGIGRNLAKLKTAQAKGIISEAKTDPVAGVAGCDLVLVATPVSMIADTVVKITPAISKDAVITDVGSTKLAIVSEIAARLPAQNLFIGSHPMAGSEKSGYLFARNNLFESRTCVVIDHEGAAPGKLKQIVDFWELLGCKVLVMSAREHDFYVAISSHLPHFVAVSLIASIRPYLEKDPRIASLCATGFRDTTRIASSDPVVWSDIFTDNSENILAILDSYTATVEQLKTALASKDKAHLRQLLGEVKDTRDHIYHA